MGGVNLKDEEWNQIIEEVDANKDGKVIFPYQGANHSQFYVDFTG